MPLMSIVIVIPMAMIASSDACRSTFVTLLSVRKLGDSAAKTAQMSARAITRDS